MYGLDTRGGGGVLEVGEVPVRCWGRPTDGNITILQLASVDGHLELVRLLGDAGAASDIIDNGWMRLATAAVKCTWKWCCILSTREQVPCQQQAPASTLHLAAYEGPTEIIQELISAGADVKRSLSTFQAGKTALHLAVYQGRIGTTRALLAERSLETVTDTYDCLPKLPSRNDEG